MMSVRCAGSLMILLVFAAIRPDLRAGVKFRRMMLQGTRGVVHFGSQTCWALAITLLPFATVLPSNSPFRPGSRCSRFCSLVSA